MAAARLSGRARGNGCKVRLLGSETEREERERRGEREKERRCVGPGVGGKRGGMISN